MELFSPEHWDLLLKKVESQDGPIRNRKAERLWAQGYDAWHAENNARARSLFQAAVLEEPVLADGYLGLYALDGPTESVCQALAHTADRLREYQRRLDRRLSAYYFPLFFAPVPLGGPNDARLALVRHLSRERNYPAAQVWLERANGEDSRTWALSGRLALDAGRHQEALEHLQRVAAVDDELRGDAHLGVAVALEALGLLSGAASALKAAEKASDGQANRYARYRLARVYDQSGQTAEARRLLEQLYAEDARYLDVGERLGLGLASARPTDGDPWQAIVRELESGRVIRDPQIYDNR